MLIKLTDNHVFLQPVDDGDKRVLAQHYNAPLLKEGYRLPKLLWIMRELVKSFPALRKSPAFVEAGRVLKERYEQQVAHRKNATAQYPELRPYQNQDVAYLSNLEAAAVFNEPRTGKTPTIIKVLHYMLLENSLIVCPASLQHQWAAEIRKFWKHVPVTVVSGKNRETKYGEQGIRIVSKSLISRDRAILDKYHFDAVVVDEAHFLRNHNTEQSKAVFRLKADHRYALTGTPIINDGTDYYGILHFLYPKMFTSYWQFAELFFVVDDVSYNGVDSTREVGRLLKYREEAFQQMIAAWSTQRLRKDVMAWLPEKTYTTILVEMGPKQRAAYKSMVKTFEYTDDDGNVADAQNIITKLTRIRQLCQDPSMLGLNVPSAKTEALLEYIEDHRTEPLVVMTWFTNHLERLAVLITKQHPDIRIGFITGQQSNTQKNQAAKDFQAGKLDILLCNTLAAGTGFTLDRGDTVIFLDKPWTAAELGQAEDRVCPTIEGKDLKHHIVSIVCKDSVDQHIDMLVSQKEDVATRIKQGGAKLLREMLG